MKVEIKVQRNQFLLCFTPENEDDEIQLRTFGEATVSPMMFYCRGFQYLKPSVEFIVQQMRSGD